MPIVALHLQHVFPQRHFVEAGARPAGVRHQLLHGIEGGQAVRVTDERDARGSAERGEHLLLRGGARHLYRPVMQMRERFRHLDRHGDHVEVGIHRLRIRPLVTGNARFRHERVHDAAEMTFPGIERTPQQCAARAP